MENNAVRVNSRPVLAYTAAASNAAVAVDGTTWYNQHIETAVFSWIYDDVRIFTFQITHVGKIGAF